MKKAILERVPSVVHGRLVWSAILKDTRLKVAALRRRDGQVLVTGDNDVALVIVDFGQLGTVPKELVKDLPSRAVKRISLTHLLKGRGEQEQLVRVYRLLGVPVPVPA